VPFVVAVLRARRHCATAIALTAWLLAALAVTATATARGAARDRAPVARAAWRLDDPLLSREWQLRSARLVGARGAWATAQGEGVLIAVLDTGVDLRHPDIAPNLWTNPREIAGNGRDDDGDGYVDDVHGVDLVNGSGAPNDDNGHGTHVAALAAARGGDGVGLAGAAPRARIMPIKVHDRDMRGDPETIAAGVRYALAHGARIINVSANGDRPSAALDAALREAAAAGAVVVASAGNDGRDLDAVPSYPASSRSRAVLAVGASDRRGRRALFSNRGRAVRVLAPGVGVLSAAPGAGFERRSGTSMSAATVSGALALLASARPGVTPARARTALVAAARRDRGRLDVAAALRRLRG
jgi:subtilisin family serine protease